MNKTGRLLVLVLILAAGIVGGAITGRMSYTVPTQAQRPDRPPVRTPERWEYCSLSKAAVGSSRGGLYWITYFRDSGAQIIEAKSWQPNAMDRQRRSRSWARMVGRWLVKAHSK